MSSCPTPCLHHTVYTCSLTFLVSFLLPFPSQITLIPSQSLPQIRKNIAVIEDPTFFEIQTASYFQSSLISVISWLYISFHTIVSLFSFSHFLLFVQNEDSPLLSNNILVRSSICSCSYTHTFSQKLISSSAIVAIPSMLLYCICRLSFLFSSPQFANCHFVRSKHSNCTRLSFLFFSLICLFRFYSLNLRLSLMLLSL